MSSDLIQADIFRVVQERKKRGNPEDHDLKKQLHKIARLEALAIRTAEQNLYSPRYKAPLLRMMGATDDFIYSTNINHKKYRS